MALRTKKKLEELKKTKARIKELQERQALLEKSIKREEDEEIVRVLRSLKPGHDELVEILEGIQNGAISIDQLKEMSRKSGGKKEDLRDGNDHGGNQEQFNNQGRMDAGK